MLMQKLISILQKKYNLEIETIHKYKESGYRNLNLKVICKNATYNLVIYKNERGILNTIRNANAVSTFLATFNFPVRIPVLTVQNLEIIKINKHYAVLYNFLPGNTIAWEGWKMNHLKLLGKVMALFHNSLKNFEKSTLPDILQIVKFQIKEIKLYFDNKDVIKAIEEKLKLKLYFPLLNSVFQKIKEIQSTEITTLHMDMVRGNILFGLKTKKKQFLLENFALTGVIDFEKVASGIVEFDLARTLAFLYVDCKYKSPKKVLKYFLHSGYFKHGKANLQADLSLLEILITYYLFYDFYKFLLYNPYEFLIQNNHFVRTVKFLISCKLLVNL